MSNQFRTFNSSAATVLLFPPSSSTGYGSVQSIRKGHLKALTTICTQKDRSPAKTREVPPQRRPIGPDSKQWQSWFFNYCVWVLNYLRFSCKSQWPMPCTSWLADGKSSQNRFVYLIQRCCRMGAKEKCIFLNCLTQVLGTNHSCLDPCLGHLPPTSLLIPCCFHTPYYPEAHFLCK